jgi:single-stranded-DNA-specific exonuclease
MSANNASSAAEVVSGSLKAHKKVRIRPQNLDLARELSSNFSLHPVLGRIMAARGFKADMDFEKYIKPSLREGMPDPADLKGLEEAVKLIDAAVQADWKVAICCDFDVDGLSGGAQLAHFLNAIGVVVEVFVPDRFKDGYGLNSNTLRKISQEGFKLLVAIDFGTTAINELNLARELGLKTIVVDHHVVGEHVTPADVFINPQQNGCGFAEKILCAAGLVWYLLVGLRAGIAKAKHMDIKGYLDLACLGTICDMVPLRGANRVIAKRGLELLENTPRVGLQALKNVAGIKGVVSCSHVSFGIGPRLNAAGRMVHGELVIELLTTNDSIKAVKIARRLNELNQDRQDEEGRVKDIAVRAIEERGAVPSGIVIADPGFHTGVIGIVAQRLVENFYRPAAVLGVDTEGVFKGSVRGIKGLSVVDLLADCKEHLIKFGGHEGAGGFSLKAENLELFSSAFNAAADRRLAGIETCPFTEVDSEVEISELSLELINQLENLAPFGMGNPSPTLLTKGLRVVEIRVLKSTHLKVGFSDGKRALSGMMWRATEHPALTVGSCVNLAYRPDLNEYQGQREIYANIQALERA